MKEFMKKVALILMVIPSTMMVTLLTSSTNLILQEYADYPVSLVTSLITVPNLTVMLGLFISPMLMGKISAKNLIMFGLGLYTASAIVPLVVTNFYLFFLMRILLGIGCGIILPMQATYVATYPEKERAFLMGITTSVVCLIAAALVAASGFMVETGWRNVFLLYLICLVPLVLTMLFIPNNPQNSVADTNNGESEGVTVTVNEAKMSDYAKVLGIYFFMLTCSYLVVSILGVELAPYMANTGLGDATSSGLLMSFSMLGSLVSGLVFSLYLNVFKGLTMPSIFLFSGVGCAFLWLANSIPAVAAAVFIVGFFSAMIAVAVIYELSCILPLQVYTGASAAANMFTFVLQFVAPLVFLGILNGVGGSFRTVFFIYMIFQLVMAPVAIVLIRILKKV